MSKLQSTTLARASIWLIPLLWSVNYYVARKAPGVIAPYMLTLIRWGLAGVVLTSLSFAEIKAHQKEIKQNLHQFFIFGFCGMVVCGAWVYLGAKSTTAMNIALIYAAAPVLIAVGSVIWLKEKFRPIQIIGVVIALVGVLHVIVKGQWSALSKVQFVIGDAWIVAATLSWATYSLLQKLWKSSLSGNARLAVITCAALPMLMVGAIWEQFQPNTPPLSLYGVMLAAAAAIFPGILAYLVYSWAQQLIGASKVAITFYLGPLYAALIAWLLLDEHLYAFHLQAALLILPGVYFVSQAKPKSA